jgi:hypothetical protein
MVVILTVLGTIGGTAFGYVFAVRTGNPEPETAMSMGMLMTGFGWLLMSFVIAPAQRTAAISFGLMWLAAALAYVSYAFTGSGVAEGTSGFITLCASIYLLIRNPWQAPKSPST